jgi:hypothetical protein
MPAPSIGSLARAALRGSELCFSLQPRNSPHPPISDRLDGVARWTPPGVPIDSGRVTGRFKTFSSSPEALMPPMALT